jgi:transglutaminase-like putative cysteine protease
MIERIRDYISDHLIFGSWFSYILLISILAGMMFGIADMVKGLDTDTLFPILIWAVGFSLLLYFFRVPSIAIVILALLFGLTIVPILIGNLGGDIGLLLKELGIMIQQFFTKDVLVEPLPFTYAYEDLLSAYTSILIRTRTWLSAFPTPAYDPGVISLFWSLLIWLISIWANIFFLKLKRPFISAFPAMLTIGITSSITRSSSSLVFWMLAFTWIMIINKNYVSNENKWNKIKAGYTKDIRKSSYLDPKLEDASNILGLEETVILTSAEETFGNLQWGQLPNSQLINSSPELADHLVMYIEIEPQLSEGEDSPGSYPVNYFRGLTYDRYTEYGWLSTAKTIAVYEPGQSATSVYGENERPFYQEVEVVDKNLGVVHSVGELAVVNTEYQVSWRTGNDKSLIDMFGASIQEQEYNAFSIIPFYGEEELRNTSQDYSLWIRLRYMTLPEHVSDEVYVLAQELTATELTTYDRAKAIEAYLRTFPYTLNVPEKPSAVDFVDFFLFDIQKGYCDYYATAMVVLARAAGLPARIAVGYIGAPVESEENLYKVTADLAHSWVEIYFPEYGWIPFEPTAGRAAIERVDEVTIQGEGEEIISEEDIIVRFPTKEIVLIIFGVLLSGLLIYLAWLVIDIWILRALSAEKVYQNIYARVLNISRFFDIDDPKYLTPFELAKEFKNKINRMYKDGLIHDKHENLLSEISVLLTSCSNFAYNPDPKKYMEKFQTITAWTSIRKKLAKIILLAQYSKYDNQLKRLFRKKEKTPA